MSSAASLVPVQSVQCSSASPCHSLCSFHLALLCELFLLFFLPTKLRLSCEPGVSIFFHSFSLRLTSLTPERAFGSLFLFLFFCFLLHSLNGCTALLPCLQPFSLIGITSFLIMPSPLPPLFTPSFQVYRSSRLWEDNRRRDKEKICSNLLL